MPKNFGIDFLKRNKIKSSSLSYALFVIIIIGVVLFSLIIIGSFTNKFFIKFKLESDLIEGAKSTENYLIANYSDLKNKKERLDIGEWGTIAFKKKWGWLNMLQYQVFLKKDSIRKTLLLENSLEDSTVLFLKKNDKQLLLAGKSTIKGDIRVPFGELDVLHLSGHNNALIFEGEREEAIDELPKIRDFYLEKNVIEIEEGSIYSERKNSFFKKTKKIRITSKFIENLNLTGNYILESDKEIFIGSNNRLNDIIIKAPIVRIEKGFKGAIQVFSTDQVIIEDNVMLEYPSVIYAEGKSIKVGEKSKILGTIALGKNDKSIMKVLKNAIIVGDLFCSGILEFKGEMYGTMYVGQFYLKTDESEYQNALLNFKLEKAPLFFKRINFCEKETEEWEVIKRIN